MFWMSEYLGNLRYFAADIYRSKCLHVKICDKTHYQHSGYQRASYALFYMHYAGNVFYHKFSHSVVFYRFNGENVNAILQYIFAFLITTH